ncbi:MAG: sulfatase-like hydrolase/transferase, partial [Gammaproteobacteria bacterium]|nr:sulfatase-like hydrolase/transferase [Gammaproteobacteria bacterium]
SIRVIKANRNRPFFLYLAHWGTHTPLQATREDYAAVWNIKPHRLRVYAAMIRALDRSVGRIMAALEDEGLALKALLDAHEASARKPLYPYLAELPVAIEKRSRSAFRRATSIYTGLTRRSKTRWS